VSLGEEMGAQALPGATRPPSSSANEPVLSPVGRATDRRVDGQTGSGCVPVPTTDPETGDDRHVIDVSIGEPGALGAEFFRFELAVAIAGHTLSIDPFDEPMSQSPSQHLRYSVLFRCRTRVLRARDMRPSSPPRSVHATMCPCRPTCHMAGRRARGAPVPCARRERPNAVTAGYGPRFLHSTGQLHKGGPNSVIAVQLVLPSVAELRSQTSPMILDPDQRAVDRRPREPLTHGSG